MSAEQTLVRACRSKGNGYLTCRLIRVPELRAVTTEHTPVRWDGPVLPWFGGRPLISNEERKRILAHLDDGDSE